MMVIGFADLFSLSPVLVGKESITCYVIEALGRPYEYDEGVLEELTDIRAQA